MSNLTRRGPSVGLLIVGLLATVIAVWALAGAPGTIDQDGDVIVGRTLGIATLVLGGVVGVALLALPRRKGSSDEPDRR